MVSTIRLANPLGSFFLAELPRSPLFRGPPLSPTTEGVSLHGTFFHHCSTSYYITPPWLLLSLPPSLGGFGTSRFHSLLLIGRPPPPFLLGSLPSLGEYPKHQATTLHNILVVLLFLCFPHTCYLNISLLSTSSSCTTFPQGDKDFSSLSVFLLHRRFFFITSGCFFQEHHSVSNTSACYRLQGSPSLVVGLHHPTRQPFGWFFPC